MRPFELSGWPARVVFGPGRVRALPELLLDLVPDGARRPMVVCGPSVARGPILAWVQAALRPLAVAVFTGAQRGTLLATVRAGAEAAGAHGADVLISIGGGSAIDTAKCVALWRATAGDWEPYAIRYARWGDERRRPLPAATLPHVAVPTTAGSASEVMPGAGCRDPDTRTKVLFRDGRLLPRVAVLDPELAVFADPFLTAATGMTAVARSVEALYSRDRQPVSEGLALQSLRLLARGLPRALAEPADLAARAECQLGCLLSGLAVDGAMASLVHAAGHVLGGRYGLQHGVAHALLLPPAMRLLLPALGEDQRKVAGTLGTPEARTAGAAGQAAAAAVAALAARSPLPRRLRDAGVPEADLADVAARTLDDHLIAYVPGPVSAADVLRVLREAW